ncbi:ATPase [Sphingobium herbicidovorans NBRC 16415]|uniref:ATPase n=1 Tax=Sphingobium herbicidovorans (strain ATCC 700291 / DSM 11019 / CCUG 56400 / KCTC 2939 / LMG 18315 / NBRC 16415 / MH) TaxID=1219045 RepID=A0A086PCL8_SPHHM|nr:ATP-binding protein [Sphingobium herbicidovorans]KFG91136.1 ATPase [Sphingobium herbicidovorans NBRC 16415]
MNDNLLSRIAEALERIAPPPARSADLAAAPAYVWDGVAIQAVEAFAPVDYDLLTGIDMQKETLLENTRRHAAGHAAHDVLLWGARGTGKSAVVAAVVDRLQRGGEDVALLQCAIDELGSLPRLFSLLRATQRPFILFLDDLGFDENGVGDARALRSLLQGGTAARPANVRLYVTSNRRHIVPRHLSEQDDPVNPRDVIDDKMALSDRFGLSLGFHAMDQDAYVDIVSGYAASLGLTFDPLEAIQWATQRGSRSGRVAWQYVVELAGRNGIAI